jgi:hypothetical protein
MLNAIVDKASNRTEYPNTVVEARRIVLAIQIEKPSQ